MFSLTPSTHTTPLITTLTSLPPEVQEVVLSHLPLPSTLALASTCSSLLHLVTRPPRWSSLLRRSTLDWPDLEALASFLASVEEAAWLRGEVEHVVLEQRPAEFWEELSVRCTSTSREHLVSMEGLLLLLALQGGLQGAHRLVAAKVDDLGLVARDLATLPTSSLVRLEADTINYKEDWEEAVVPLVAACRELMVDILYLPVHHTGVERWRNWRVMARVLERGRVRVVETSRQEMAVGRREDLRRVWGATTRGWRLAFDPGERRVAREGREEEGWREIEVMLDIHQLKEDLAAWIARMVDKKTELVANKKKPKSLCRQEFSQMENLANRLPELLPRASSPSDQGELVNLTTYIGYVWKNWINEIEILALKAMLVKVKNLKKGSIKQSSKFHLRKQSILNRYFQKRLQRHY